jgi:hypothetical protein
MKPKQFNRWYLKHQDRFELGRAYIGVFVLYLWMIFGGLR